MSVFSKIFICINLFFTLGLVGIMGGLLSQKADYRAKYIQTNKSGRDLRAEMKRKAEEFKQTLEGQGAEDKALSAKIKGLESAMAEATAKRQSNEEALNKAGKQRGQLQTKIVTTDKVYASLDREVKDLIGQLSAASKGRSDALDLQKTAGSGLKSRQEIKQDLEETLASLQRNYKQLGERKKQAQFYLREAQTKHGVPVATIAQNRLIPDLKGVVEKNTPEVQLCIISLGKNDGVYKGLVFRVSRGNQYIGLIKVKDVFENMSSCRYMTNTFYPGRTVGINDQVVTERK